MNSTDQAAPSLTAERTHLSRRLSTLADNYRAEAELWADTGCTEALLHNADQCDATARRVLASTTVAEAEAIAAAAEAGMRYVLAYRHLIEAIR